MPRATTTFWATCCTSAPRRFITRRLCSLAGLDEELAACGVDVALLPVNGRDQQRRAHGILGNFTFDEATALCIRCKISAMIACHFGMFDFNTVAESWLDEQIARTQASLQCVRRSWAACTGSSR